MSYIYEKKGDAIKDFLEYLKFKINFCLIFNSLCVSFSIELMEKASFFLNIKKYKFISFRNETNLY
jgi:hypothetical protein